MKYMYFSLDKNPKQIKKLSLDKYDIDLRIEWNSRSNCWYVLGYIGDDLVLRNTKIKPKQFYRFNEDSGYYLPYIFTIYPSHSNYDWDTNSSFFISDDVMAETYEGLIASGGMIDRSLATSSNTHSKKSLRSEFNRYLFDVVKTNNDDNLNIICADAGLSFKSTYLPQGRWDFTINGVRTITSEDKDITSVMLENGVEISSIGNNEYLWINNTEQNIKIEGVYPYASGYNFNVDETSNDSMIVRSRDNNEWVNRFTVCLVSEISLV